jgi:hypothetical protein
VLGNVASLGIVFLVSGDSFSDVDLENEPNVVCGPYQTEHTAYNNYDPLPGECHWSSTSGIENFLEVFKLVIEFQHIAFNI